MLCSRLCDYSDAYILAKGTITVKLHRLQLQIKQIMKTKRSYLKILCHLLTAYPE